MQSLNPKIWLDPKYTTQKYFCSKILSFGNILEGGGGGKSSCLEGEASNPDTVCPLFGGSSVAACFNKGLTEMFPLKTSPTLTLYMQG